MTSSGRRQRQRKKYSSSCFDKPAVACSFEATASAPPFIGAIPEMEVPMTSCRLKPPSLLQKGMLHEFVRGTHVQCSESNPLASGPLQAQCDFSDLLAGCTTSSNRVVTSIEFLDSPKASELKPQPNHIRWNELLSKGFKVLI